MENTEIKMKRKFVKVSINNKEVKFKFRCDIGKWIYLEESWQTNSI